MKKEAAAEPEAVKPEAKPAAGRKRATKKTAETTAEALAEAKPAVVDLRNIYPPGDLAQRGFVYGSVGRPSRREK